MVLREKPTADGAVVGGGVGIGVEEGSRVPVCGLSGTPEAQGPSESIELPQAVSASNRMLSIKMFFIFNFVTEPYELHEIALHKTRLICDEGLARTPLQQRLCGRSIIFL